MPELDWKKFNSLPGSATSNWESLCRAIILRGFGSLGSFRGTAMQPGVEFHLRLQRHSDVLGDVGRWWGWQCRWYDLPAGSRLGVARRRQIVEAIRKSEEKLPYLTDWVLWTRRPLVQQDQDWFFALTSAFTLQLWNEWQVDAYLEGDAAILRKTYFGELAITDQELAELRERSLAPVKERWNPLVHVEVEAERELRRVLGEMPQWPELDDATVSLAATIERLEKAVVPVDPVLNEIFLQLTRDIKDIHAIVQEATSSVGFDQTRTAMDGILDCEPQITKQLGRRLARGLRRAMDPCAPDVQAALGISQAAIQLVGRIRDYLALNVVAIIGDAGQGKTYLAAELTSSTDSRPCGLYLEAWPLTRNGTVDDLLPRLRGLHASSFEEILEAIESAGARAGVRIPIAIDGLTEAEDPTNWRRELASLTPFLAKLSHVVVVVTLRPSGVRIALPDDTPSITLPGFGRLTDEAVARYFTYYKIDMGGTPIPLERFNNPLFLRIFCEATNPDRTSLVGPESIPSSLIDAFARFRENSIERIANRPSGPRRYAQDILRSLDAIAAELWQSRRRALPFNEVRKLIGDNEVEWTRSLAHALEDEGILIRDPDEQGLQRTSIIFDAFAGFLIADSLVRRKGRDGFVEWIGTQEALNLLTIGNADSHPLAADVRVALAALTPRMFRIQLWPLLPDPLRIQALLDASEIEGVLLDAATLKELGSLALLPINDRGRDLFDRFRETCDALNHPLNAEFLDRLLSELPVVERDMRWSEWVRRHTDQTIADLKAWTEEWRSRKDRGPSDSMRALWCKWLLTSTVRSLRDRATLALFWFGRGEPRALFTMASSSVGVNDLYVPDRLLAASYGALMAAPSGGLDIEKDLNGFLDALWASFVSEEATNPTDHWLIRDYVGGIVELAGRYYPSSVGRWSESSSFQTGPRAEPIPKGDPRAAGRDPVYGFDFKNYTVGRLVPDRSNYQENHPGYQEVLSRIRGRVWEIGWRPGLLDEVDGAIARSRRNSDRPDRIDLYNKKYGWIAFFEAAGRLEDEGNLSLRNDQGRLSDADIDPSFPDTPPALETNAAHWMPSEPTDLEEWMRSARVEVPESLLRTQTLGSAIGPWIATAGWLEAEDIALRHRVFGFIRGLMVPRASLSELLPALRERAYPGNTWIPDPPESHYVFAGEFPWSHHVRHGLDAERVRELYLVDIDLEDRSIAVELAAHDYSWESYHSILNDTGSYPVAPITFGDRFDLRPVANSFNWCDSDGKLASITTAAPTDFKHGDSLYLREDLVVKYCEENDYEFVWFVWGERDLDLTDPMHRPDWTGAIYGNYENIWRTVVSLSELKGNVSPPSQSGATD